MSPKRSFQSRLFEFETATPESGSSRTTFHLPANRAEEAVYAFGQAVAANPAFAFVSSYTSPAVTGQITRWRYDEGSETEETEELDGTVSVTAVQNLGGEALSDLLPVDRSFRMGPGTGYAVNWQVALTFADNSTLLLTSSGTLLFAGAPWFVEIDGQRYMQYSTDFLDALLTVTEALDLPPQNAPSWTREVHWFEPRLLLEEGFNREDLP